MKRKLRSFAACLASAVLTVTSSAVLMPVNVSASVQLLGETGFEYKMLPWHAYGSSPAKQFFVLEDGALHIAVLNPEGADKESWDLQINHKNLSFKAGHTYKVSFNAKSKRDGMELISKICSQKGDEEYLVSSGDKLIPGHDAGGEWGTPLTLTKEYRKFSGEFAPDRDIEAAQWTLQYAKGERYGGNAQAGDEIWFDNMSVECVTCGDSGGVCAGYPDTASFGMVSRDYCTYENPDLIQDDENMNYISVNQLGYYPNLSKTAVLGDNRGDILYGASSIDLGKGKYTFELVDTSTQKAVYTGITSSSFHDKDSQDSVCRIDFSDYTVPGRYFLRIKDKGWRSLEFDISYNIYTDSSNNMLTDALNYFYQNRSGIEIGEKNITSGDKKALAHRSWHPNDTAAVQKTWKQSYTDYDDADVRNASSKINVTGGWYDDETGSKNVTGGGTAVWMLQNMYERAIQTEAGKAKFADDSGTVIVPESGNKVPDILDEAAYELDWMSKMVVQPDEPTWGRYAGLVYNGVRDHKRTGIGTRPYTYIYEDEYLGTARIIEPPTFAATLNYAACAAQAARLWKPYNEEKSAEYLADAEKCYQAYLMNYYEPDYTETMHPIYNYVCPKEVLNEKSLFCPDYDQKSLNYSNLEVMDEAYWAACELYITTGDQKYYKELKKYKNAFSMPVMASVQGMSVNGSLFSFDRDCTNGLGTLSLLLHKDMLDEKEARKLTDNILDAADEYVAEESRQGYGIPYRYDGEGYNNPSSLEPPVIKGYERDSNFMVINNAIVMAYAYDTDHSLKYMNGVTSAMNYLLGCNPLSFSYITGYGSYSVKNPTHQYWANEIDKELPSAPGGVLSSGPNSGLEDEYVRALGFVPGHIDNPSQRCYIDSVESWSTNSAAMDGNASLAWIVSFLQDEGGAAAPAPSGITGDFDGDGKVTVDDLALIQAFLTKSDKNINSAYDVNGDGKINVFDAVAVKRMLAK